MKRIAYSFLLIFLLSCGSSSQQSNNRIRIEFRDSVKQQYYLLAVRDSALIVSTIPVESDNDIDGKLIRFAQVRKVFRAGDSTDSGLLTGIIIGALPGSALYLFLPTPIMALPLAIGMIIGGVIGCAISRSESEFDPRNPHDRYYLRELARFPAAEPPELQKIK
jgi:hypothetical protein